MFYEIIRPLTCNFSEIEKYIPKKGKILDVGCGHGLLAKLIASKSLKRSVLGIDPSVLKINAAETENKFDNLTFKVNHLGDIKEKFDCIVIVDVLYLFPQSLKIEFIKKARSLLNKEGKLILVENGDGKELIFKILRLQETLMTKVIKYTRSEYGGLHFLSAGGYEKIFLKLGLKIEVMTNIKSILPYPHFLIVAKNPT